MLPITRRRLFREIHASDRFRDSALAGSTSCLEHLLEAKRMLVEMPGRILLIEADVWQIQPAIDADHRDLPTALPRVDARIRS